MKRFLLSGLLMGCVVTMMMSPTAQAGGTVARAVLLYSPECLPCEEVLTKSLPPLMRKYGDRLQILRVNVDTPKGRALFEAAIKKFHVPAADQGVPALVIGDHLLLGNREIPRRFPILISRYLLESGVDWPDLPGLSQAMAYSRLGNLASRSQLPAVSSQSKGLLGHVAQDPLGGGLALAVLLGMLSALGRVVYRFFRTPPRYLRGWRSLAVALLVVLGLGVAAYLAYAEAARLPVLCGPVANCNAVRQTKLARLFGVVPWAYLGVIGYLLLGIALALNRLTSGKAARAGEMSLFGLTFLGTMSSIYLTALEPFVIGAVCLWCLSSSVIMTLLLLLTANGVTLEHFRPHSGRQSRQDSQ